MWQIIDLDTEKVRKLQKRKILYKMCKEETEMHKWNYEDAYNLILSNKKRGEE